MSTAIGNNGFVDLNTITSRSEDASFPDDNVGDYWHLKRRFRAGDNNVNDWLLKFDFGVVRFVSAVVLNDVNFDKVQIYANGIDGAFPWVGHDSGVLTVNLDPLVNRYKIIYIPSSTFAFQWLAIFIPAGAVAVGSYTAEWQVGSVVVLDAVMEVTKNIYSRTSVKAYQNMDLLSGSRERISLGEIKWEGSIGFDMRKESDETNLWTLNNIDSQSPLILYKNKGDTSRVYLCLRDDAYEGELIYHGVARGNTVNFKELI